MPKRLFSSVLAIAIVSMPIQMSMHVPTVAAAPADASDADKCFHPVLCVLALLAGASATGLVIIETNSRSESHPEYDPLCPREGYYLDVPLDSGHVCRRLEADIPPPGSFDNYCCQEGRYKPLRNQAGEELYIQW